MTWKNDEEKKALAEKVRNPEKVVVCPTCSGEITFHTAQNSYYARCERCGIFAGARGL